MPNTQTREVVNIVLKMKVAEFKESQINYYDKINYVIAGRYRDGVLDLSDFRNDVEFSQIFVPLNTLKGISNVIKWAATQFHSGLTRLNMQRNEIKKCAGLQEMICLPKLTALDLQWNNIEVMEDFSGINHMNSITDLYLDGNPICKNYSEKPEKPMEFISDIKKIFNDVVSIDGVKVKRDVLLITRQNYLCSPTAYTMVENFVRHFFTLYDSPQRSMMRDLYSKDSIFTMSCFFQLDRVQQYVARVREYANSSRNILKMSDYASQSTSNLLLGAEKISKFFDMLPQTEHDPMTFTIDVPMHEPHMTLIIVCGVFREKANSLLDTDFMCGFSRTFLLKPYTKKQGVFEKSYEYKIYNEHLHLHNTTIAQKAAAFKDHINNEELENSYRELLPTEIETKEAKIGLFKELTELTREWCIRYVKFYNYP